LHEHATDTVAKVALQDTYLRGAPNDWGEHAVKAATADKPRLLRNKPTP
jgi:hypothetical protein